MRALLALLLALAPVAAEAQTIATSAAPERVSVTVYRDPNRQPERRPNLRWLGGYALISETRRVSLPAGEVDLRFEGVAGGIIPASAIVSGLPDGVLERNRDARLLSPGALVDAALGRRVTVRRTSRQTGETRLVDAVARSGPDEALVLETADGVEALRCSGLPEALVFPGVPAGLSAKPTLSVRTRAARAWSGEVTLSYLATGFDWTASYVGRLNPAGDRLDLFAWVTLANGDETGFREAETQAVAGRVNREATPRDVGEAKGLTLRCWPGGTTSDTDELNIFDADDSEEIVVTGSRISGPEAMLAPPPPAPVSEVSMQAIQEELGDLKLYRIPEPVTVAARSQKQVAMLQRPSVRVSQYYRTRINGLGIGVIPQTLRMLRTQNLAASGLGLPLPGGRLALHADGPDRPVLIGQGFLPDYAVGEDVDIEAGAVTGIVAALTRRSVGGRDDWELIVTSDLPRPVAYEAHFSSVKVVPGPDSPQGKGTPVWRGTLPANGRIIIRIIG